MIPNRSRLHLFILVFFILNVVNIPKSRAQNASRMDLSGCWKLTWNEGIHGANSLKNFFSARPLDSLRYIDISVPMDVNKAFHELNLVDDPNYGINSLKSRWIGQQCYQYYRRFKVTDEIAGQNVWLVFDQLDLNAIIYLNGQKIAEHSNAHLPCRINVTGMLKEGEALLTVGIESGLYGVSDREGSNYDKKISGLLNKRHWQRKPQYQFGWDWNPVLVNVGITGNVRLEWSPNIRFDQMVVWNKLSENLDEAQLTVRSFIERAGKDSIATIQSTVVETGQKVEQEVNLERGLNLYVTTLNIKNPQLWWPIGHGDHFLYTIKSDILINGIIVESFTRRTGIRKVEIDQSEHTVTGKYFIIKINNRPIFMKGGNWVPPDLIYSNITKDRINKLVDLAVYANFNMLRLWGGGTWAGHDLLDVCDEKGIMVWHDLLFACTKYPGNNVDFSKEVRKEITWALREFSSHPSLIVWCGNNELEFGTVDWSYENWGHVAPDYSLFHLYIPKILKEEDQNTPYWPSSPFSPDNNPPNSPLSGDQHPWSVSLGKEGTNFWAYRDFVDRFPNEGGFLGASTPATLRQFLPPNEQFIRSFSWEHHDNAMNYLKDTPGMTYKALNDWMGINYTDLSIEHYAFASGVLQAEALAEYINNYRRRMFSSACAVFWMYNDSWPVTHGWTIVDYYQRKKIAYYPVKRAFTPVSVVVVKEGDNVVFYGVNDSPSSWKGELQYGLFSFNGEKKLNFKKGVVLPSNTSFMLASFPKEEWDRMGIQSTAAFAVLSEDNNVQAQHRLILSKFKDNKYEKPEIKIERKGNTLVLLSPVYVWAVTIDADGESTVSDNCFDLFPNMPYTIEWPGNKDLPKVLLTGNEILRNLIQPL